MFKVGGKRKEGGFINALCTPHFSNLQNHPIFCIHEVRIKVFAILYKTIHFVSYVFYRITNHKSGNKSEYFSFAFESTWKFTVWSAIFRQVVLWLGLIRATALQGKKEEWNDHFNLKYIGKDHIKTCIFAMIKTCFHNLTWVRTPHVGK